MPAPRSCRAGNVSATSRAPVAWRNAAGRRQRGPVHPGAAEQDHAGLAAAQDARDRAGHLARDRRPRAQRHRGGRLGAGGPGHVGGQDDAWPPDRAGTSPRRPPRPRPRPRRRCARTAAPTRTPSRPAPRCRTRAARRTACGTWRGPRRPPAAGSGPGARCAGWPGRSPAPAPGAAGPPQAGRSSGRNRRRRRSPPPRTGTAPRASAAPRPAPRPCASPRSPGWPGTGRLRCRPGCGAPPRRRSCDLHGKRASRLRTRRWPWPRACHRRPPGRRRTPAGGRPGSPSRSLPATRRRGRPPGSPRSG